jgi:hypothetical protein
MALPTTYREGVGGGVSMRSGKRLRASLAIGEVGNMVRYGGSCSFLHPVM